MKHKFIAKKYWKDKSTPMGQVDQLARAFDHVIDLSLGDPDIVTHSSIIEPALEDAKLGHTKYTDFRGDPELREEISKDYKERFGVFYKDENIMVTAGACLAMYLVLESICDEGDEVIIHAPYFTPYYQQIELAGGVPVELDTFEEEDFEVNVERLEEVITERTRAIILNSPNNPTGTVFTRKTIENIVRVAKKHDLVIISDEIYDLYSYDKDFISFCEYEDILDRTVIINSFSKNYVMTGWRVGNIIAPKEIIKTCQLVNENVVFTASSVSQRAAIYALRNKEVVQQEIVEEYRKRVMYAAERINKIPWMSVLPPKGTFYLLINVKKLGISSEEASQMILEKAKVLTIPGISFGQCGEGYVRIACTVGADKLKEAFDRIEKIKI